MISVILNVLYVGSVMGSVIFWFVLSTVSKNSVMVTKHATRSQMANEFRSVRNDGGGEKVGHPRKSSPTIGREIDDKENALLSHAVCFQKHDVVERLLKCRTTDVNKRDKWGFTPLHLAVCYNNMRIIRLIVDYGGLVNVTNNAGKPLLHDAVNKGRYELFSLLLDNEVDVTVTDNMRRSALHSAAVGSNIRIIKSLIEKGLDPTGVDGNANTVLHQACRNVINEDMVQLFLSHGVQVNAKNVDGETPLHRAHYLAARILLRNGAEINDQCNLGDTPLHKAVLDFRRHSVRCLLENGAKTNVRNNKRLLAIDLVRRLGDSSLMTLFAEPVVPTESEKKNTTIPHPRTNDDDAELLLATDTT